jgi:tRNA(Ile)-lysidine synthase
VETGFTKKDMRQRKKVERMPIHSIGMRPERAAPVSATEAKTLFADLRSAPALVLAVSGGPDSTALMLLAARWRAALKRGPRLVAVTIDHALRAGSAREARAVKALALRLGILHRTMRWSGAKPATGLQEAARAVRYRLLASAARTAGAAHILTAHTRDDQAETVLLRMARGSGLTGLTAMARQTLLGARSAARDAPLVVVRPLLDLPKARLIATLDAAKIASCDDPSNRDPRFTRARLRELMPALAGEGLDSKRLALMARRVRRAEAAIEFVVGVAAGSVSRGAWSNGGAISLDAEKFLKLPAEVALRLLGRAILRACGEAPLRLGRLEALYDWLIQAGSARRQPPRLRRTLAGAQITLTREGLTIEPAPPRSKSQRI